MLIYNAAVCFKLGRWWVGVSWHHCVCCRLKEAQQTVQKMTAEKRVETKKINANSLVRDSFSFFSLSLSLSLGLPLTLSLSSPLSLSLSNSSSLCPSPLHSVSVPHALFFHLLSSFSFFLPPSSLFLFLTVLLSLSLSSSTNLSVTLPWSLSSPLSLFPFSLSDSPSLLLSVSVSPTPSLAFSLSLSLPLSLFLLLRTRLLGSSVVSPALFDFALLCQIPVDLFLHLIDDIVLLIDSQKERLRQKEASVPSSWEWRKRRNKTSTTIFPPPYASYSYLSLPSALQRTHCILHVTVCILYTTYSRHLLCNAASFAHRRTTMPGRSRNL